MNRIYKLLRNNIFLIYKLVESSVFFNAIFFALISSITYVFAINNNDIELIRIQDDKAFDIMNYAVHTKHYDFEQKILVFEVDNNFLKKENLMDEDGLTNENYGDSLPRRYLIKFIEEADKVEPKLLFIDYNLSLNMQPKEDVELIKLLKKDRSYPIYFIHNENFNFIERTVINANVKFVSTVLAKNKDGIVRRYESFIERKNPNNKIQKYYYAPLVFANTNVSDIKTSYDVTKNRFIFKGRFKYLDSKGKSFWNNITFFSFEQRITSLRKDYTKGAIIFLGENHSSSSDVHIIYNGYEKSGVEILANSLASIYYFNPQLKLLPMIYAILILFITTFFVRIISLKLVKTSSLSILFFITIAIITNAFISYFIFIFDQLWFNYIVAYVAYIVYDIGAILNDAKIYFKEIIESCFPNKNPY